MRGTAPTAKNDTAGLSAASSPDTRRLCALPKSVPRLPQRLAADIDTTNTNKYNSLMEFTCSLWCRLARAYCQKGWPWGTNLPPTLAARTPLAEPVKFEAE